MLSRQDRQTLADLEQRLRRADPDLARLLENPPQSAPPHPGAERRIVRLAGSAGLAFGSLLLVTAIISRNADLAVAAFVILFASVAYTALWKMYRRRRCSPRTG
jgi:Flp pilus assembly protein TadB